MCQRGNSAKLAEACSISRKDAKNARCFLQRRGGCGDGSRKGAKNAKVFAQGRGGRSPRKGVKNKSYLAGTRRTRRWFPQRRKERKGISRRDAEDAEVIPAKA
ncbi:MAG: hypothetical protein JWO44_429 [Bacteroidetes bacterium]|nr:hypothetical protein [Bacteroidota bacterium]